MSREDSRSQQIEQLWQRKKSVIDEQCRISIDDLDFEEKSVYATVSTLCSFPELKGIAHLDEYLQELVIGRRQEEVDNFLDLLANDLGHVDDVLLFVLTAVKTESKVVILLDKLLHRGAFPSTVDKDGDSPLHLAAHKNWRGVATKLLENDADTENRNKMEKMPLHIAIEKREDEMCALLLSYMPNYFVRELFLRHGDREAELSLHNLITLQMEKTVLSVLDSMMEVRGSSEHVRVYYSILESDESGNTPENSNFNSSEKSTFQKIALQGNKNIVYHDVVRLLVRKKWNGFGSKKFQFNCVIYLMTLLGLTFSAVTSVMEPDPAIYRTPLDRVRATFEVFALFMVLRTFVTEINQLRRHRLEYFSDVFNIMDMVSAILLLMVPALRFSGSNAQWHVFACGFLVWVIRIFKFAAVFRQTGAYAQMLGRVIMHDFVQFGIVFSVVLLAFSGSFFLSLRGDNNLNTHNETSTFRGILFVGVRTLSEAQPVVQYTGSEGYSTLSTMFMLGFLFVCCVILLNILIAQLNDTYQKVQHDAERGLEVNRAWIIARMEINSFYTKAISICLHKDYRRTNYTEFEDITDLRKALGKCKSPPLNDIIKCVRDVADSLNDHKRNVTDLKHQIHKMQEQMEVLLSMQAGTRGQMEVLLSMQAGTQPEEQVWF